jgi:hypothetical protein
MKSTMKRELTMELLEGFFEAAKDQNAAFFGVKIRMEGFPDPEIIIKPRSNFKAKLKYYKEAYNKNLVLKSFRGISIEGFCFGDSFEEIQRSL